MIRRSSVRPALAIGALTILTIWLTWRAKNLEVRLGFTAQNFPIMYKHAPDFTLPALNGGTVSLADYRGKKVVISFWASWCGPCRLELPVLKSFFDKAYKRDGDFEILTINLDESRESAEAAIEQGKLPFLVLWDPAQKTANAYGVNGIPCLFIVDRTGHVVYASAGFNQTLRAVLANQLGVNQRIVSQGDSHLNGN